jgi:hypothetical protein
METVPRFELPKLEGTLKNDQSNVEPATPASIVPLDHSVFSATPLLSITALFREPKAREDHQTLIVPLEQRTYRRIIRAKAIELLKLEEELSRLDEDDLDLPPLKSPPLVERSVLKSPLFVGRSVASHKHTQQNHPTNGHCTVRRCGLKMTVNGESVDGFGDTGSSHNIVDAGWVKKRNITVVDDEKDLTMGNGSRLHSQGYVELDVRFARERVKGEKIVARVVKSFPFDLLLSRLFLEATGTLKQFIRRFTKCVFPRLKSIYSVNLLSGEPDRERFHGLFNDDIEFEAVLDTGSNCNIMRWDWAQNHHLHISTDDKHRGWISLPSNERVPTIGRVYVDMTLPAGKTVPLEFQVLEEAAVPIILGDDVVLDHELYSTYSDSIYNVDEEALPDGVLMLDFMPWYATVVQKAKQRFAAESTSPSQTVVLNPNESKRRWAWNKKYSYGKTAPATEWAEEYKRREMHEKAQLGCGDTRYDVRLIRDVSPDLLTSIGELPFRPSAGPPVAST